MHPKSPVLTLLAATFLSIGCSTTVESFTTTPSSEDESAPHGSAAESDELAFNAGPSALRYARHPGASYALEGTGDSTGGSTGGGDTDAGTDSGTTATTVSTNATTYAYGDQITISFANMAGNSDDWVSIAPADKIADPFYYSWWRYTKSATSSSMMTNALDKLPPGTYVARAYFANGYEVQATSAEFTVTGTIPDLAGTVSTDKSDYTGLESVQIEYSGLGGSATDWVGAYLTTGSMFSANGWTYTDGQATGTVALWPLYAGTWEIRAFSNDTYELQGRSAATITVTPAVKTDKTSYTSSENVVVTFGGMAGYYATDSVAIATAGSPSAEFVAAQYVNIEAGGTRTFSGLGAGTYVARAYFHGTAAAQAESVSFTITQ